MSIQLWQNCGRCSLYAMATIVYNLAVAPCFCHDQTRAIDPGTFSPEDTHRSLSAQNSWKQFRLELISQNWNLRNPACLQCKRGFEWTFFFKMPVPRMLTACYAINTQSYSAVVWLICYGDKPQRTLPLFTLFILIFPNMFFFYVFVRFTNSKKCVAVQQWSAFFFFFFWQMARSHF